VCTPLQFNEIQSFTGNASYKVKPQHILEIVYTEEAAKKFEQLESVHGKIYAYHGTRVENFHSILHNGLLNHMNKVTYQCIYEQIISYNLLVVCEWSPLGLRQLCSKIYLLCFQEFPKNLPYYAQVSANYA